MKYYIISQWSLTVHIEMGLLKHVFDKYFLLIVVVDLEIVRIKILY